MLNFHAHKGAKHLNNYFKEHLSKGDYHSQDGEIPGTWIGETCRFLGIEEGTVVDSATFQSLSNNLDPRTGTSLTQRQKSTRRSAYDFSFSAPKSVSIAALIGGDERLLEAHREAVTHTYELMQEAAGARMRTGNKASTNENINTGNLIGARFEHSTSRENDPQVHTHIVTFNCTWVKEQKRFLAAQVGDITKNKNYFTAIYRNDLAQRVSKLGYRLETAQHGWRIRDVPKTLEDIYSKRSNQIKRAAEASDVSSNKGRALLAMRTRANKGEHTDAEKLELARGQITSNLKEQLDSVVAQTRIKADAVLSEDRELLAREAVEFAIRHTFERESVTSRMNILTQALNYSQGRATIQDLNATLKSVDIVSIGGQIAEKAEQKRENDITETVLSGIGKYNPIGDSKRISGLSESQAVAANTILGSRDRVSVITGKPGTGKTHTLKQLLAATELTAVVTAPRAGAAQRLRDDGLTSAMTVKKLLVNLSKPKNAGMLGSNSLLVIDEAGLISTKAFHEVLAHVRASKCRVLLIGDDLQHHSVESGDALRLITNFTRTTRTELYAIRRQKDEDLKRVVKQMADGHAQDALASLDGMGRLKQCDDNLRPIRVAEAYSDAIRAKKSVLVVTPTWNEHAAVTEAIRTKLKSEGVLSSEEIQITTLKSDSFTLAQKMTPLCYKEGHIVTFHADTLIFKKGESWKVVNTNYTQVVLSHRDGRLASECPKNFALACDVAVERPLQIAKGDKILLQANAKTDIGTLANGEIVEVANLPQCGAITLTNGHLLPTEFRQLTHGYAVTSQGSQGKDVDRVIVSIDAESAGAISQNQLNVSASRGKESIEIFTNSKKKLLINASRSERRDLIVEASVSALGRPIRRQLPDKLDEFTEY